MVNPRTGWPRRRGPPTAYSLGRWPASKCIPAEKAGFNGEILVPSADEPRRAHPRLGRAGPPLRNPSGAPAIASCTVTANVRSRISREGRYVGCTSQSPAVVGLFDVFNSVVVVYDRTTGENALVSCPSDSPTPPAGDSYVDAIGGDGRY